MRAHAGLSPSGHLLVLAFGPGTVIGGLLFGAGMTVAGMCAAGTLLRIGEGYVVAWITLVGFVLGAALDPFRAFLPAAWGTPHAGVWLGEALGLAGAALLTLAALGAAWMLSRRSRERGVEESKNQTPSALLRARGAGSEQQATQTLDRAADRTPGRLYSQLSTLNSQLSLPPEVGGGIALGLLNTVQVAAAMPWTIAGPLALVPHAISGTLTHAMLAGTVPLVVVNAGLVLGASASRAGQDRRWRLRWPRRREQVVSSLLGGVAMAWGLRAAHGCSVGGAFSALSSLSLSGWLFFPPSCSERGPARRSWPASDNRDVM